jgi:pimeloyl-ACP methyl ester carboxylesterase
MRTLYQNATRSYLESLKNRIRIVTALALATLLLGSCMTFRKSDRKLEREFGDDGNERIERTQIGDREIRYVESGTDTGVLFFFIHGAPGSLDDFLEYVIDPQLQTAGRLVSFDRPGYGYSRFGDAEPSMGEHARVAMELLSRVRGEDRVIVVSHSYGGTVALRMAVDYPGAIERYVLLAPSASAEDEIIFWFNRPASRAVVRWMLPRAWRVANVEKMAQRDNLRAIEQRLDRVSDRVVLIHGTDDSLVPVEHAYFLADAVPAPLLEAHILEEEDHFFIWRRYEEVRSQLLSLAADLRSDS